jgi:hypothetical protein
VRTGSSAAGARLARPPNAEEITLSPGAVPYFDYGMTLANVQALGFT